jgi:hypothetical protein
VVGDTERRRDVASRTRAQASDGGDDVESLIVDGMEWLRDFDRESLSDLISCNHFETNIFDPDLGDCLKRQCQSGDIP